jgi:hypothetical protein
MCPKSQRDLLLVLTIIGSSICLLLIVWGIFLVADDFPSISAEVVSGNYKALLTRARWNLPQSVFSGIVFIGTWLSYRRYHKLTLG